MKVTAIQKVADLKMARIRSAISQILDELFLTPDCQKRDEFARKLFQLLVKIKDNLDNLEEDVRAFYNLREL